MKKAGENLPRSRSSSSASSKAEPDPTLTLVGDFLRELSTNTSENGFATIQSAIKTNETNIAQFVDTFVEEKGFPPVGEVFKTFCITGKDISEGFLPKIMKDKKGIDALALYIEKPTVVNLVSMLWTTGTLTKGIWHYIKSCGIGITSFSEKVGQKTKLPKPTQSYGEQVSSNQDAGTSLGK